MCPFAFLRRLATVFRVNARPNDESPKLAKNDAAVRDLSRWKVHQDLHPHVLSENEERWARQLLANNLLPVTHYEELRRQFPCQLQRAELYVLSELASLARYSEVVEMPHVMKFADNICFSFHEVLTVFKIVLRDLEGRDLSMQRLSRFTRKIALNNATHHNSVGGGIFHLYLEYAHRELGPIFEQGTGRVVHSQNFMEFAVDRMTHYAIEVETFAKLSPEEREYQFQLLMHALPDDVLRDPEEVLHFVVNIFHGRGRVGCPFMRAGHLVDFVEQVLKSFGEST